MFIDPKGEEIDFSWIYSKNTQGNYVNQSLVDAFEFFAASDEGRKFLADYAIKGQTIGGYTFKENGKYHNKGINLFFKGFDKVTHADASTSSKYNDKGGIDTTIKLSQKGVLVERYLDDMGHEAFIHAFLDAKDFYDNGKLDLSSVDKYIVDYVDKKIEEGKIYKWDRANKAQHFQERNNNNVLLMNNLIPIMKGYYQKKGIKISDEEIVKNSTRYMN
ncbi:hypothetical protein [Myroides sp. DF42-4-2]|uniref:hypothetical protein n=1 Tax=unclassified Myroides TaxID=2642485 RepID=UPI0025760F76|nr:hypothetical protein [Myroides sp. DF42-4-2]